MRGMRPVLVKDEEQPLNWLFARRSLLLEIYLGRLCYYAVVLPNRYYIQFQLIV
jgi:hypothetical protein